MITNIPRQCLNAQPTFRLLLHIYYGSMVMGQWSRIARRHATVPALPCHMSMHLSTHTHPVQMSTLSSLHTPGTMPSLMLAHMPVASCVCGLCPIDVSPDMFIHTLIPLPDTLRCKRACGTTYVSVCMSGVGLGGEDPCG